MSLKVIEFHSENYKRVRVVDITPDGYVQIISGINEQGKSSVIDALWSIFEPKAVKKETPRPVREGEDKAINTADLGDYIVTRTITPDGKTQLKITTPEGNRVPSPQKLLDGITNSLAFDPWKFANKDEKEQRKMLGDLLYDITDGKVDLAEFERRYKEAYDQRTIANREKARLELTLRSIAPPTNNDPIDEISVTDLAEKLKTAMEIDGKIQKTVTLSNEITSEIARLEETLAKKRRILEECKITLKELEPQDIESINKRLEDVEVINKRAREVQEYKKIKDKLTETIDEITALNEEMELADIEKAEALEDSPLPVSGFNITEDGVMVLNEEDKWVPFKQASAARKLKISLAIAMASNPTLRVIRISDGSLLDDNSMDIIRDMAKEHDFQIWVEYASRNTNDRMGVYIEDGQVAG